MLLYQSHALAFLLEGIRSIHNRTSSSLMYCRLHGGSVSLVLGCGGGVMGVWWVGVVVECFYFPQGLCRSGRMLWPLSAP